jgi:hypothetical protein
VTEPAAVTIYAADVAGDVSDVVVTATVSEPAVEGFVTPSRVAVSESPAATVTPLPTAHVTVVAEASAHDPTDC